MKKTWEVPAVEALVISDTEQGGNGRRQDNLHPVFQTFRDDDPIES